MAALQHDRRAREAERTEDPHAARVPRDLRFPGGHLQGAEDRVHASADHAASSGQARRALRGAALSEPVLRLRPPGHLLASGQVPSQQAGSVRAVRAVRELHGAGERVHRAEQPHGAARAVHAAGQGQVQGRRRGTVSR